MGYWTNDGLEDHEGFAVGLVEREILTQSVVLRAVYGQLVARELLAAGTLRELCFPDDEFERSGILVVQAACDCGWRSSRFTVREPASWQPFTMKLDGPDEARARELWDEHCFIEIIRRVGQMLQMHAAEVAETDPPEREP